MRAERHLRAKKIFLSASDLPRAERDAFLATACAGDAELRAEVEELLDLEQRAPGLLAAGQHEATRSTGSPGSPVAGRAHEQGEFRQVSIDPKPESPSGSLSGRVIQRLQKRIGTESRYEILGEFARGGMGAILKVWDRDLRRTLAMKVVLGRPGPRAEDGTPAVGERILGRFVEEAQVTGQLDHPGIVPVHELGLDSEGQVYFTMRLVKGIELGKVFELVREKQEGWTLTRAIGTIHKACEAMAYAHSKNVIHRDLKPANVMVGRFGEVYVMDWGLARVLGSENPERARKPANLSASQTMVRSEMREESKASDGYVTLDGDVLGTPAYMSPEQARGQIEELGPASDVYSMGAILYHLLAGHIPYGSTSELPSAVTILGLLLYQPPAPLSEVARQQPAELVAICEKAMAREPGGRYPSMRELAEDVSAYLEGRVVGAHQSGLWAHLSKWVARNKGLTASLAGLFVLSLASVAAFIALQSAKLGAVRTEQAHTMTARDEARRESYVASIVAADASLRANEVREAKRLLADARIELRGWEWRHLSLRADASQHVLAGHTQRVRSIDLSPDGRRVASSSDDGSVRVWNLDTGQQMFTLPPLEEPVFTAAFRSAGAELLTLDGWSEGHLRIFDVASGRETSRIDLSASPSLGAASSRDGRWLAFGTVEELVHVIDLEAGREVARLAGHQGSVHAVAFDPVRARLLSASDDGTVRAWPLDPLDPGAEAQVFQGGGGPIYALACAPSGTEFATASADGAVRAWRLDGSVPPEVLWQCDAVAHEVLFSADGKLVASAWSDKTIRVLDRQTGRRMELRGHDGDIRVLAFTFDARRLVSGGDDATLRVWDLIDGGPVAELARMEAPSALALRGDGALLAVGSRLDGSIRVFEPGTSEPYAVLSTDAAAEFEQTNDLAFAPDGTLLAAAYGGAFVRVFRLEDRSLVHHIEQPLSVTSLAFHPSAARLATGSANVRIWDALTGTLVGQLGADESSVRDLAWHPDGTLVAAAYDEGRVVVWDVATSEPRSEFVEPGLEVTTVCWNPAGHQLALGVGDHSVRLWWPATARSLSLAGHEGRVSAIVFQGEKRMLSSSFDGSIRVWDVALAVPESLLALRGHQGAVTALAVSPDGEELFSAAQDGSVKSWRARRP